MPMIPQIGLYEYCNLAEILQVALLAARDVRDMAMPGCAVDFGGFLFAPDLNDK